MLECVKLIAQLNINRNKLCPIVVMNLDLFLSRTLFQIRIWNSLANNNNIQMNAYAKKR